jgi:hypothetical protein
MPHEKSGLIEKECHIGDALVLPTGWQFQLGSIEHTRMAN